MKIVNSGQIFFEKNEKCLELPDLARKLIRKIFWKFPVQGGYIPVQGGYIPVQGGYIPVQGGYIPVQGGYIPVQGGYIPVQGGYIPKKMQWK